MTVEQRTALTELVSIDREIMHGIPCFSGTRIPIQTLMDFLETGEGVKDFLAVYPYLSRQQVAAFLELSKEVTIQELACASS